MSTQAARIQSKVRLKTVLLLMVLLGLPPLLPAEEKGPSDKLYDQAVEHYQAGRSDEALGLLNQVIEQKPGYADACVPRRRTGGRSPPCSHAA